MNKQLEKKWHTLQVWMKDYLTNPTSDHANFALGAAKVCAYDIDVFFEKDTVRQVKINARKCVAFQNQLKRAESVFLDSYYQLSDTTRNKLYNQDGNVRQAREN
jgi:hypothetical protein